MPKRIKTKIKKKGLFNRGLFKLAAVAVIAGCAVLFATTLKDCSDKEKELARIESKIEAYRMENEDMQRTLDSDDLSAYMERSLLRKEITLIRMSAVSMTDQETDNMQFINKQGVSYRYAA